MATSCFIKYIRIQGLKLHQTKLPQYQFFRYARGNRLRKLNEETDRLEKILANFQQKQEEMLRSDQSQPKTKSYMESLEEQKKELVFDNPKVLRAPMLKKVVVPELELPPTVENQFDRLAQIVTPLHNMPYEMQLKKKHSMNLGVLKQIGINLREEGGVQIPIESHNIPCVLDYTIASPVTESYRNKDEFSIRAGVDGNPKTVGFFMESTADNHETKCIGPDKLIIIKDSHKHVAKEFENYIRQSPLPACHNFSDGGHWRNIVVRSNNNGDIMAIVVFHPQKLSEEQIEVEKNKLRDHFLAKQAVLNLKSFYFQVCSHTRCTHAQAPFQLLFGEQYISEEVNGLSYQISPESFFQINTPAASLLYKVIVNTCKVKKSTTVLDICCGIGPISLTFAPKVKQCIGIDSSVQAIEDAKANAAINGIKNVEFHAGKFEHLVRDILNEIYVEELVAVINPARSALGKTAIRALRECRHLKKVVFVSCKAVTAIPNYIQLCQSSGNTTKLGSRFHAIRAVPVDLFPHTLHSELVILFQRI